MRIFTFASVTCLSLLAGCAYTTNVPVTADNPNVEGFRHFGSKPLLVISGGVSSVVYVPDPSKEYAMRFGAFLAKNDMKFVVSDGRLGEVHTQLDSTAGVAGLLDIAKTIAEDALDYPTASQAVNGTGGPIRVFEFVFDETGTRLELREILSLDPVIKNIVQPSPATKSPTVKSSGPTIGQTDPKVPG